MSSHETKRRRKEYPRLSRGVFVRVFPDVEKKIERIVNEYPDKFDSKSHFLRSSIMHMINFYEEQEAKNTSAWNAKRVEKE